MAFPAHPDCHSIRIDGVVVHGDKRGRVLGFPTANLAVDAVSAPLPADGVYCCQVDLGDSAGPHGATCSIGLNPTFGDVTSTRVEVFIHDFEGDLYGQRLTLRVLTCLREMRRFESVAALISQTEADVRRSRALLERVWR
ncbi:Riboflavin biosynthesis protein RibF [Devosia equisanguinis]|uniref:riboflavin kinase n=1 Tax=Devosia equisanguinis TaxID=2490941 RepID=A0A447ICG8_9HYPH|nr:riboflavin kinase [Devosia equisanguinis]VDS05164.1 Riboflavin biosynthesis protein RibF [Devosia equisanguinis]